ncbi:glycoside hydrolase family 31 protein [Flavivirga eckloniae]|uniref:Glycoside hydrolase n=1 Tax=Flavivirga eckloniae TaxID=1803846 RepID=A0A2K9PNA6_9FLAO|nr:glycoside hydrolase family 31 protein [Flavivirga eckloniae]AUP78515.1 glycoside hydrolase [Flavivirga eckloniae]
MLITKLCFRLIILTTIVNLCVSCHNNAEKKIPKQEIVSEEGTHWWAGITADGHLMPMDSTYSHNLIGDNKGNQIQPLLLSSKGDLIWSEAPFNFTFKNGTIVLDSVTGDIVNLKAGNTLKEAYLHASDSFFKPSGKLPDELLFSAPQYNTWIELVYDQNQEDILKYAHAIIDNGFPPGVLMIDDNWQEDYGKWDFHPGRFSNPKAMMDELHDLGFKVMLWVCPFVSPDCDVYRDLVSKKAFLVTEARESIKSALPQKDFRGNPKPEMVTWWNGISAVLDLSNPVAVDWFKSNLENLKEKYGVDGFKFDAGDTDFYRQGISDKNVTANDQTLLFGAIGLDYPLNEYRAMWKMGGQPLVERLRDKNHSWEDLQKLIPQMALEGIMGYYFSCPDMIGGGDFTSFINDAKLDQELIVRSAQCHALMPMMQFSVSPWRVLDEKHFNAVKKSVELRSKYSSTILKLAKEASLTGEPILRSMEYEYPNQGYATIKDQFLMGKDLLIAPALVKGQKEKDIIIPKGNWKDQSGNVVVGPKKITVKVDLNDLPIYVRQN